MTTPRRKILILSSFFLVVFCFVLLGLLYFRNSPTYYKFQTPVPVKLSTTNAGVLSFSKPSDFISNDPSWSPWKTYSVTKKDSAGNFQKTAYLMVATAPVNSDSLTILNSFNKKLKEPISSADYKQAIAPITNFVKIVLSAYKSVSVSDPASFTNNKIKNNAWEFNVAASGGGAASPDMQGKAVYAWTNNAAYFYILSVSKNNWQPNMETWQSMLNSISLK